MTSPAVLRATRRHGTTALPPPRRRTTAGLRQRLVPYGFLAPMVMLFLAFKAYPLLYAAWLSLTTNSAGANTFAGLSNYDRLFHDPLFYRALENTGLILLLQVPVMLALAILLAVAFNSALLRWRALWRMAYFVPIVMGLVAYGILFSFLLGDSGLVNRLLTSVGLPAVGWLTSPQWAMVSVVATMTWHYTGQSAIIYLAQLQSIPIELMESATVDGASAVQRFWHITLPGLRPAITLTVILSSIGTLQLFDEPYVLTNGGPDNATLTVGIYLYQNAFKYFDFGYASAIGYVLTAIIGLIALVQFRLLGGRNR